MQQEIINLIKIDITFIELHLNAHEKIAISMAQAAAIDNNTNLSELEMRALIDSLFSCQIPNYTQGGKTIIHILKMDDVDKLF